MGKKSVKVIFGILIGIFVFANVFLLNVVLHEAGHYWAAEHYALEPEIAFNFENITGAGFSFKSIPIAYTSFLDNGNLYEMGVIALMGPFVNLLLGILFMLVFAFVFVLLLGVEIFSLSLIILFTFLFTGLLLKTLVSCF